MNKLELTLETVTPMFLRGADGSTPELRPPAFRGVMRYWLRAALGGVIGDNTSDKLREFETKVFGNTESGSPIVVRLHGEMKAGTSLALPHKVGGQAVPRNAFQPDQSFVLILQATSSIDEIVWQSACASLSLALLLGGVGLRSRRGGGSLRVVSSSNEILIQTSPLKLAEWNEHIQTVISQSVQTIQKLAGQKTLSLSTAPAKYPCASKGALVRLTDAAFAKPTAKETIIALMNAMPNKDFVGYAGPGSRRQASPLWAHVLKADEKYHLLLSTLPSDFIGHNEDELNAKVNQFSGSNILIKGWNTND